MPSNQHPESKPSSSHPQKGLLIDKSIRHHFTPEELEQMFKQNEKYQKKLEEYLKKLNPNT